MRAKYFFSAALLVLTMFTGINLAKAQTNYGIGTPVIGMTVTDNASIEN